jgi:uncharacterized protein YndB with AHSA1/START domain
MVPERLEREVVIEAPQEVVWSVITEPEHINRWFGDMAEIELQPGGRLFLRWEDHDHTVHGWVEKVEPPHFLAFRWRNGGPGAELPADDSTLVEFSLSAAGEGTRLKVVETGFRELSVPEDEKEEHAEGHRRGWVVELDELRAYAETR